jgi:hypothetical protein
MTSIQLRSIIAAVAVGAGVLGVTTPAQAVDNNAVKRAIVTTVLKNLGVEPTAAIIDSLVSDLPIDQLAPGLVKTVGASLDAGSDPTLIVSQSVDTNGDGVPDENGALDSESSDSGDDNASGSSSSAKGSSSSTGGSTSNGNSSSHHSSSNEGSGSGSSGSGSSGSGNGSSGSGSSNGSNDDSSDNSSDNSDSSNSEDD